MTKEEAIKIIKRELCRDCGIYLGGGKKCPENCSVIETINALSAEPIRPKGKWIDNICPYMVVCSVCGYQLEIGTDFCPNCGADMRGE